MTIDQLIRAGAIHRHIEAVDSVIQRVTEESHLIRAAVNNITMTSLLSPELETEIKAKILAELETKKAALTAELEAI